MSQAYIRGWRTCTRPGYACAPEVFPMRRAAKFHLPPKGERCAKVVLPKGRFMPRSFRWVKSGPSAYVLVGCPKAPPKGSARRTTTKAKSCPWGLRAHMVLTSRTRGGHCKAGYKLGGLAVSAPVGKWPG